jgi:hypothetical protein
MVHPLLQGAPVTRPYSWCAFIFLLALVFTLSTPARTFAQQPPVTTATAAAPQNSSAGATQPADEDDDALFRPLEPDFTLINLPTTLPLPVHKGSFRLTHRFNGNLERGDFGDQASTFFGIDEGATIGFEYRFAVAKHVEVAAYRTNASRTIQLYGKYDAVHQSTSKPLGISGLVSIEGTNNFRQEYAPAIGASISRDIGNVLAVYAVPMWVHNTAAATGVTEDTTMVGLGGSVRVRPTLYLIGEVTPRVSGYVIGDAEYGFGISARVGGHVFDLTFTNSQGTTFAQMARGGFPDSLFLGFNLARKFF